jgi:rfaE bifunctional protein kinase chain/domain
MDQRRIKEILARIENVTVAVYGDFCLDAYWMLDPKGSEVSEETGLHARAVARHYYSLGGASNVVANLAALKPKKIHVIGVIGDDIFGRELRRQFDQLGVDTTYLVVQRENFDTVAFGKPYLAEAEEPRIDFGFFNRRSAGTDRALLEGIRHALQTADALIANEQVPGSITDLSFIEKASQLFHEFGDKVVLLDSRHYGDRFQHIYRKTNDREAARLNGVQVGREDVIPLAEVKEYAQKLYQQFHRPVFLTRGARGLLAVDSAGVHEVPGIQLLKKLDPVGAGDTVTSALALCLGAGVAPAEAAEFANFAAAVTVQKLFQTGTANGVEILAVAQDPDLIYRPELAEDPRQAWYVPGTEIEICEDHGTMEYWNTGMMGERPAHSPTFHHSIIPTTHSSIRHAVFDHDGTVSTLRQGWEQIMAPVMMKAILGDRYETADEKLYEKVRRRVLEYIDRSAGVQTLVQMEALVGLVREFDLVPPDKILDRFGYKKCYNDALMVVVHEDRKSTRLNSSHP